LEFVERDREAKGFEVLPKQWIVERTFSWLIRNRRLSKNYERLVQTSEPFVEVAMVSLYTQAAGEGSVNLTKQALRLSGKSEGLHSRVS
jgi:putative transposase